MWTNVPEDIVRGSLKYLIGSCLAVAAVISTGCLYHFNGGGLPPDVKTIAVVPFDNQTPISDLQREISDSIRARLLNKLGVSNASAEKANAVVRGTIHRYQVDIPVGYSANTQVVSTAQRMLEMVVDIDITDQTTGKSLWSRKGFVVDAQYKEQGELQGRSQAIDIIVNTIVDGIQSQW